MTIHVWIIVSSPNFHRLCIWIMYIFWYISMPNVTAEYGRFSNLIAFFGNFHILLHVWNIIIPPTVTNYVLLSSFNEYFVTTQCSILLQKLYDIRWEKLNWYKMKITRLLFFGYSMMCCTPNAQLLGYWAIKWAFLATLYSIILFKY